jgi:hypothetical protein
VTVVQYTCKQKQYTEHNETEYANGTYKKIRIHKHITLHTINISKQLKKVFKMLLGKTLSQRLHPQFLLPAFFQLFYLPQMLLTMSPKKMSCNW